MRRQLKNRIGELNNDGPRSIGLRRLCTVEAYPPPVETLEEHEYEYCMEDSPRWIPQQKHDSVMQAILKEMRELSRTHMCFAACKFWLYKLFPECPPLWPPSEASRQSPESFYAVKEIFEEFPIAFRIRLSGHGRKLKHHTILVEDFGTWRPLKEWFSTLPDRHLERFLKDSCMQLRTQQHWWNNNGLSFPLMDLPGEVRNIIYRHVLGGHLYPHDCNGKALLGHFTKSVWNSNDADDTWTHYGGDFTKATSKERREVTAFAPSVAPNLAILRVNRKVHGEALNAAWLGTVKHFRNPWTFMYVMDATLPSGLDKPDNCLSKLHLDFGDILDWFQFLGVKVVDGFYILDDGASGAQLLKTLPASTEITLSFPDPHAAERELSGTVFDVNPHPRSRFPGCQKHVVDMILNFLFPSIKHFGKIRLAGYIKMVTQRKWDWILKETYEHRNDEGYWDDLIKRDKCLRGTPAWDWAVPFVYNHEEEMKAIERLNPHYLPECQCPNPCDGSRDEGINVFDANDDWNTYFHWDACMLFRDAHDRYPVDIFGRYAKDDLTPFRDVLTAAKDDDEWVDHEAESWNEYTTVAKDEYSRLPLPGSRIKGSVIKNMKDNGKFCWLRKRKYGDRIYVHDRD